MQHVAIIGGTTFDHIVYLPTLPQPLPQTIHTAPFQETIGSTGSGKALNLTRLGVPNSFYSVIGDDSYGNYIREYLEQQKVDFIYDIDPKGTERHINIMDAEGNRISMFITQSSEVLPMNTAAIKTIIEKSDLIVLNIVSYCKQLIPLIKQYNKPIWTDLHDYDGKSDYHQPFIETAQYIHLSSDNLPDYRLHMEKFIDMGKELVICTHGKEGATALTKTGVWIEEPAIPNTPIVDANGAGDSFFSGFLYGYIQNYPVQRCMKMGALSASLCVASNQLASDKLSAKYLVEQTQ